MDGVGSQAKRQLLDISELEAFFRALGRDRWSGQIRLFTAARAWVLFLASGRFWWADGGAHPRRRLRRRLHELQCAAEDRQNSEVVAVPRAGNVMNGDNYTYLLKLCQSRGIPRERLRSAIAASTLEVLFDLWAIGRERPKVPTKFLVVSSAAALPDSASPETLLATAVLVEAALEGAQREWHAWHEALGSLSNGDELADCAPKILQPEQLRGRVNPATYNAMAAQLDGNNTLRDVAARLNLRVPQLTKLLQPLARDGILAFETVADWSKSQASPPQPPRPTAPAAAPPSEATAQVQPPATAPLIACIDDSEQSCQLMQWFLEKAGYRFCHTTDPTAALSLLLSQKPALIFLDLVMPGISGYELCTAIRRVSLLEAVPIVIITGRDGLVDRVRAKMAGATSFMAKPLQREAVLNVARAHLSHSSS